MPLSVQLSGCMLSCCEEGDQAWLRENMVYVPGQEPSGSKRAELLCGCVAAAVGMFSVDVVLPRRMRVSWQRAAWWECLWGRGVCARHRRGLESDAENARVAGCLCNYDAR
jgi:hypothetical protein